MTQALVVSNVVLWVLVIVLSCIVVALARQIGVLYERVAPAGALSLGRGPAVGEVAPLVRADDLTGRTHEIGGPRDDGRSTLVFFLSPSCPVCKQLLPAVRSAARREHQWLDVLLASDGPREEHEAFAGEHGLDPASYVLSAPLGVTHQVAKLPYAVLLDGSGVVRAKGLVNSREHLESLFEAVERGLASIQDWAEHEQAKEVVRQ